MVVDREIAQGLVPIDNLLSPKHNIICAHINKPLNPELETRVQDMAGSIYVDLIDTTELQAQLTKASASVAEAEGAIPEIEALIGALYLDADFATVSAVIIERFSEFLEQLLSDEMRINDYKSELQELIQKHRSILPVYKVTAETGKPPDTLFRVSVYLENSEIGSGSGRNRREAEQEAALIALKNIGNFMHFEKLSETFFGEKPKGS